MTARPRKIASVRIGSTTSAAVAVGIAAFLVRLPRALSNSFWQDEVSSARILRAPTLGQAIGRVAKTESTPPLWFALGWLVHHAGVSIHDVRLLSVLSGGIFAGLVVVLARAVLPLPQALLAGTLTTVGGYFVAHGEELRAYALFALLTVAFAVAIETQVRAPGRLHASALAACTALGLLTHYFFVFTVAAGLIWLWIEPHARSSRVRAALAVAAGLAVYLPLAPFILGQVHQDRFRWIGAFRGRLVLDTPLRLLTPLAAHGALATLAPLLLLAIACTGSVVLWRRSALGRLCALLWLVPLALASAAWLAGFRIYAIRNMIGIGAFVAIAIAAAVFALPRPTRNVVAVIVACAAVAGFAWDQRIPAPSYQGMAQALVAEGWQLHDPVAVFGDFFAFRSPLEWYLPGSPSFRLMRRLPSGCHGVYAIANARTARRLRRDSASPRTVGRFVVMTLPRPSRSLLRNANILAPADPRCAA